MAKEMESFKANSFDQDLGYDTDLNDTVCR